MYIQDFQAYFKAFLKNSFLTQFCNEKEIDILIPLGKTVSGLMFLIF